MVRCEDCVNLLTRGHEAGTGACWALPDKGKVYINAERDCKMFQSEIEKKITIVERGKRLSKRK